MALYRGNISFDEPLRATRCDAGTGRWINRNLLAWKRAWREANREHVRTYQREHMRQYRKRDSGA
jgi:hypothetical protein